MSNRCTSRVWDPVAAPSFPFMARCQEPAMDGSDICHKHHEMYAQHSVKGAARVELLKDGDDDA